jgi:hypothetical protein
VYDAAAVATLLGIIQYTAEELAAFGPPPKPVEGFVTFFDPGWSILRLREAVAGKGKIFWSEGWYNKQTFAQLEEPPRYLQVRMEAVPGSFFQTFAAQQKLLGTDEEVPLARVVVAALIVHFLGTGVRLLPTCWVRCADEHSGGSRVNVGNFDVAGLVVNGSWDDGRSALIGVAASRML